MMMSGKPISQFILDQLSEVLIKRRPTYISLDIDSFSTAYAMGCSQAWPTGFSPQELFPVLNVIFSRLDVQVLGVYEVSPPLDQDEKTVKLAAQVIHQYIGPLR
jgi:formiminoglutamase